MRMPEAITIVQAEQPGENGNSLPKRPLLELIDISKEFDVRDNGRRATLSAVNEVSLKVRTGRTLGIVGEAGCGKSTLARVIVGLHAASSGEMLFENRQIETTGRRPRKIVEQMRTVFHAPPSALAPAPR